jgi:hypothetical protein
MTRYLVDNNDAVVTVSADDDVTYALLVAETYTDGQGNLKPKYEETGYADHRVVAAGLNTPGAGVAALTLVSGTAYQDTTGKPSTVYVPLTGGSAGTVKVEIGPTSGVAKLIHPLVAANAVASQLLSIRLPALWFIKVTVSVAAITAGSQQV